MYVLKLYFGLTYCAPNSSSKRLLGINELIKSARAQSSPNSPSPNNLYANIKSPDDCDYRADWLHLWQGDHHVLPGPLKPVVKNDYYRRLLNVLWVLCWNWRIKFHPSIECSFWPIIKTYFFQHQSSLYWLLAIILERYKMLLWGHGELRWRNLKTTK